MHNSQYLDKETMSKVRVCVAHRQIGGERVKIAQVLTEIVHLGLEVYAKEKGIVLEGSVNIQEKE